jgi:secreted trypsin-like serine protease
MCSRDQTTWTLVGITSWGSSVCGAPNSPGVYTRITEYMSWIMSPCYSCIYRVNARRTPLYATNSNKINKI